MVEVSPEFLDVWAGDVNWRVIKRQTASETNDLLVENQQWQLAAHEARVYLSLFKSPSRPEVPHDLLIDLFVGLVLEMNESPTIVRIQTIVEWLQLP